MKENTSARAARLQRGPSAMTVGEQAAAHARFGTTDLDEIRAADLASSMEAGAPIDTAEHLFAVDSEGRPCQVTLINVGGFHLMTFHYAVPHKPQVFLYDDPEEAADAWQFARTRHMTHLMKGDSDYAREVRTHYGLPHNLAG